MSPQTCHIPLETDQKVEFVGSPQAIPGVIAFPFLSTGFKGKGEACATLELKRQIGMCQAFQRMKMVNDKPNIAQFTEFEPKQAKQDRGTTTMQSLADPSFPPMPNTPVCIPPVNRTIRMLTPKNTLVVERGWQSLSVRRPIGQHLWSWSERRQFKGLRFSVPDEEKEHHRHHEDGENSDGKPAY